jgi:hypothetical protein
VQLEQLAQAPESQEPEQQLQEQGDMLIIDGMNHEKSCKDELLDDLI